MFKILIYLLMFNPALISTRLTGLVGISAMQPFNPKYQKLDAPNMASRSGYFVCDNPLCKMETIYDSQDYDGIVDADFNTWLRQKMSTATLDVINACFSENDVIDEQLIYKSPINKINMGSTVPVPPAQNVQGNYVNVYELTPGFNGYWFRISHEKNVAFAIKRVLLEFNAPAGTGTVKLYMFNTADLTTPLFTQVCNITSPITEVLLPDASGNLNGWICDNTATSKGYKGDYYLGYFTSEITGGLLPFQRNYRDAIEMAAVKNMDILRVQFSAFTAPGEPFDLLNYSPFVVYNGVNPDIIVYDDFTNLITQQERMFARAIQLKAQISFLSEMIYSIRSNRNERIGKLNASSIMADIEGMDGGDGYPKVTGLKPQFMGAISHIKKELRKLQTNYTGQNEITMQTLT